MEFGRHRDAFLGRALPQAAAELDAAMWHVTGGREEFRRRSLERAGEIAETLVKAWRREATPVAENLYRQAARRFAELANTLLARLVASDERLGELPRAVDPEQGFRTASRVYFSELIARTTRPPERWLLDKLRTGSAARRAAEREAHAYLEQLFATNAAALVEDLDQRVLESRRRLEADVRSSIEQIRMSAVRALERARERHAQGSEAVHSELVRLDDLRARIARLPAPGDETTNALAQTVGIDSTEECG